MTDSEWDQVVELLATNWPHQLQPELSLAKYRRDLDDFPVEQVLVAIETLYRDGREFPPNSGQVRGQLADLHFDAPSWFEAMRTIRRASGKSADLIVEDESERGWHYVDERMVFLDAEAPLIAGFIREVGWRSINIEDGGDEARLRTKYEDFVRRVREKLVYGGLPSSGLARLERVVDGEVKAIDRSAEGEPRVIEVGNGEVRRVEPGPEKPRRVGFDAVGAHGAATGSWSE
jgi:hypothetical protein